MLLASCVAVSDREAAVLFSHLVMVSFSIEIIDLQGNSVRKTGPPQNQMIFTVTHPHSVPYLPGGALCIETNIEEIL